MKQLLLILVAVVMVGCGKPLIADPIIEKEKAIREIRQQLKNPTGELTKADLEMVTELSLSLKGLTDVKGLEKLTPLTWLNLMNNPALTKAQIDELQKALPKCEIYSNAKK